jgi:hypothetical protein
MREGDNLFLVQRKRDFSHRRLTTRAKPTLVVAQRFEKIVLALAGKAGDPFGAGIGVEMA